MSVPILSRTELYIQMSRVHRRRNVIRESLLQDDSRPETETVEPHQQPETPNYIKNMVNLDFWKRARIYPDQPVPYPDASQHVSSRRRRQIPQRERANAYVSDDTESESDMDFESDTEEPDSIIQ